MGVDRHAEAVEVVVVELCPYSCDRITLPVDVTRFGQWQGECSILCWGEAVRAGVLFHLLRSPVLAGGSRASTDWTEPLLL